MIRITSYLLNGFAVVAVFGCLQMLAPRLRDLALYFREDLPVLLGFLLILGLVAWVLRNIFD